VAVLLNALLFVVGVYFEIHPRDRSDVWAAAGVAAVALLNSAALTVRGQRGRLGRAVVRLRRIALIANTLFLIAAGAIVAVQSLGDSEHTVLLATALVLPPLITLAALVRARRS
jgi:hypothetical protein